MKSTYIMASLLALGAAQFAGCAVTDGQSTVGQYTGDTTITIKVKAKMAEDPAVSASRISVETVNGTVQLSGFATSQAEKDRAEAMARGVDHVKQVRNSIVVQPKIRAPTRPGPGAPGAAQGRQCGGT